MFPVIQSPLKPRYKKKMMFVHYGMKYRNLHTPHGFRALGMRIVKHNLGYCHELRDPQFANVPADDIDRVYDRCYLLQKELK